MVRFYDHIDLRFDVTISPYKAFGSLQLPKLKRIANFIGLRYIGDIFRGIRKDGITWDIPRGRFTTYMIKENKVTTLELLADANGCTTIYGLANINGASASNLYTSLNHDSATKLSSIVSKLPPAYDIPSYLDELERRSEKSGVDVSEESPESYSYRGILRILIVVTWMMHRLSGKDAMISASYFDRMLDEDLFNPFVDTLEKLALSWEMDLRSFVIAFERRELYLAPIGTAFHGDNSRSAILSRILNSSECISRSEMIRKLPVDRQKNIESLFRSRSEGIETVSILPILESVEGKLSDVII